MVQFGISLFFTLFAIGIIILLIVSFFGGIFVTIEALGRNWRARAEKRRAERVYKDWKFTV